MPENFRLWFETIFNVTYLTVMWWLVIAMQRRLPKLIKKTYPLARLIVAAFALLALGDSGHVGFRVLALALGNPESTVSIAGYPMRLVALGTLATTVTVTVFYVLILAIWRQRFNKTYGWFEILLLTAAVVRMIMMMLPANEWNASMPPQPWATYRNIPLIVQGLGVAFLILRDAYREKDRAFIQIGYMILVSYAFFIPVILFVQKMPLIGMLMIPKTLAYVAIAVIAYRQIFKAKADTKNA
ncbi:MAG: hypothetical protein B6I38_02990 [Anaerolineaceae bacterium 4572_5.1]|nr:MAG: hypothetical protein B6I38_02990 [Anaerolineaceae bacterium 4572_5.1]